MPELFLLANSLYPHSIKCCLCAHFSNQVPRQVARMNGSSCITVKVSDEPFSLWHVRLRSSLAAKMGYLGAVISFRSANLSVSEVSRQNLLDSWKGV